MRTDLVYQSISLQFMVLLITCPMMAQTATTGAIMGSVRDQNGRVVRGVIVRTTNLRTSEQRSVATAADGSYRLPLLQVDEYQIEASAAGFARLLVSAIAIRVTESITVDLTLQPELVGDVVTVRADSELLQRSSATLGAVVGSLAITTLPLSTRNYIQLLTLSPGVSASVPNAAGLGMSSVELSAHGANASDNFIGIDGVDATNIMTGALGSYVGAQGVAVPAPDALQEFKVQTALYGVTSGPNAGANVTLMTRVGSNQFHGTAYEYLRNDQLNANDFFFNRAGLARPALRQNQFGGLIGGPIRKDKLLFFGSYQGTRQLNSVAPSAQSTVFLPPLTDDRSRASLGHIFGGQRGFAAFAPGGLGTAVASDGSNINPVALALLNFKLADGRYLIPTPPALVGGVRLNEPASFDEDQLNSNVDLKLGVRGSLSGKYFYANQRTNLPFNDDGLSQSPVSGFNRNLPGRNHNLSITHTQVFSAAFINVARFGFARLASSSLGEEPVSAADLGMQTNENVVTMPLIQVIGQFSAGATPNEELTLGSDSFDVADSVSIVRGRHLMQVGGEVKRILSVGKNYLEQHAELIFLDFPSLLLGQSSLQNGTPFSHVAGVISFAGDFSRTFRKTDAALFFQDDIRVTSRLSINMGLRYDYFGAFIDTRGRNSNFDFEQATHTAPPEGTLSGYVIGKDTPEAVPPEVVRASNNSLREVSNLRNFAPRIGLAYQPLSGLSDLVIRGGYGIYFSRRVGAVGLHSSTSLPFGMFNSGVLQPGSTATFQNPLLPLPPSSAFPLFIPRNAATQQSLVAQDPEARDPYTQHFGVGVQYELARDYLLEVGYAGAKGTHLNGRFGINQPLLATPDRPVHGITVSTIENAILRVPVQGIAPNATQYAGGFDSNYHSLQVSVTKRLSRGVQLTAAYTFAKSLDNLDQSSSGVFLSAGNVSGNQLDFSQAKGLSAFDRRHRWVASFIWQLPRSTSGTLIGKALLNGWDVAGLVTLQSGLPLTITDSGAATIFAQSTSRAQFLPGMTARDAALSGPVTGRIDRYFNTAAFTSAPTSGNGTGFGNSGRAILRGPDQRNIDVALVRHFSLKALREGANLEFRAEAFNFTNTPSFANPSADRATPVSFGVISNTSISPRIIQVVIKLNY
jgi:hypothetical protein